jgi:hypothetical protein
MWCTVINAGVLFFLILIFMLAPDLAYRLQSRWLPVSRETFNVVYYSFIGFFKLIVLVFNLVPWIVLSIIG